MTIRRFWKAMTELPSKNRDAFIVDQVLNLIVLVIVIVGLVVYLDYKVNG